MEAMDGSLLLRVAPCASGLVRWSLSFHPGKQTDRSKWGLHTRGMYSCQRISCVVSHTLHRGVIQAALIEKNVASPSTLAFVGSLAIACNAAFAIPNGRLTRAWGARKVAILGLILMGAGQILSGFAEKHIAALFLTAGLMMGYGIRSVKSLPSRATADLAAAASW